MIGYVTLGTNDINASVLFYEALFEIVGAKKEHDYDRFVGWNIGSSQQMFAVVKPFDDKVATPGNGTMIAFNVESKDIVQLIHDKVLELGGLCEGAPGIRQGNYYCGYCRDLDGNKLNFYCHI